MATERKNQKEMLEIKPSNRNEALSGLSSRFNTVEERINEFESRAIETFQTEMLGEKRMKQIRTSKNCGAIRKGITYT